MSEIDIDLVMNQLATKIAELEKQNALLNGVIAAQASQIENLKKGSVDGTLHE